MQHLDPRAIERAFLHPDVPSFADLMARLADETTLPPTRVRDLASGLRRVAKALGRPPADVPCDPRWLQPRVAGVSPAALGLSAKSWQNAVSDAGAAMAQYGIIKRRHRRREDLTSDWRALWARLRAAQDPTLPASLSGFVYFLSRAAVVPKAVRDEHALAYREGLAANAISRSPDRAYRAAVNGWNLAEERLVDWPGVRLALPSRQRVVRLADGVLPPSFSTDLEVCLARLAQADPFAEEGRTRGLRPASVTLYRQLLLRFAAMAVQAGVDPCALPDVAALVEPALAERGLRRMLEAHGNTTSPSIAQTAILLHTVAAMIPLPGADLARLTRLAKKVSLPRQTGMTAKNRTRLRVLQDEVKLQDLIALPDRLWARVKGQPATHARGLACEDAVAIAILTHCPIRVQNLARLHLDRNLQRPGDGRAFLVFEGAEVKTGQPLEFELPRDVRQLIERHLATRPPSLCPPGTRWLFPRRDGTGPVGSGELAGRITRRIHKETGLEVNAHLFRHLAVMILLEAHPGAYESAGRLLGHSATSHTISVYSGMETRAATKAFADLIAARKGRAR